MAEEQKPEEKKDEKKKDEFPLEIDKEPVVTEHSVTIDGQKIDYTATAGMLPIRNDTGSEVEAQIFFVAYTRKTTDAADPKSKRPLMFSFNGGPGSSSVWLHLGAVGPKRVEMLEDGGMPAPPFKLVDNELTWFTECDLVFIDPVGTGYSRPKDKETGKKFWGLKGDIESVGEFIRLYLSRYDRWASPLFLVGESYGTTRASGLAGYLVERGIAFNGIILVSSILNFLTARWFKGNDLPNILFLPTYAATAWYHGKCAPKYRKDLQGLLREVEAFTMGPYATALSKGDQLPARERQSIVNRLAEFTGLSKRYIEHANIRIQIHSFCKELLRDEGRTVGRLDSRFKGIDPKLTAEYPEFDPSMTMIGPPYTAMMNDYVSRQLGRALRDLLALHRGLGMGLGGGGYAGRERVASQGVRAEPAHEAVHRVGLLRPRHAVLRHEAHGGAHGLGRRGAGEHLDRGVRGRAYDVHPHGVAAEAEVGSDGVHPRGAVGVTCPWMG